MINVRSLLSFRPTATLRRLTCLALLSTMALPAFAAGSHKTSPLNVAFHVNDSCTVKAIGMLPFIDCTNRIIPVVEVREQGIVGEGRWITVVMW